MAKTKSSRSVVSAVSSTQSNTVAPVVAGSAGSTAASGTAAGGTGSGNSPAGTVLASLGVTNSGFTQVQVQSVAKASFQAKVSKRLNGVENFLPAGTSLLVGGQTFTIPSIVQVLQAVLALFTAKATAQAQAKASVSAAVAALSAELPTANQFLTALDTALLGLFKKGNPVLENFGLSTGVKKTPTVTTKAQAKGTAELTRKARNTMGKVQRLKVTGGTAQLAVVGPSGELLQGSTPGVAAPTTAAPAPAAGGNSNGTTTPSGS
jgi:hypothetical protein